MSSTTIGTVQLILSAQSEQLEKGFAKAGESVSKFMELAKEAVEIAAIYEAGKELVEWLKESAERVEVLGKEAEQLGVTVEAYQALQFAADATGLSQEKFGAETAKLQTLIGDLAVESAKSVDAFNRIGLSWRDLAGKSFDEQFALIADRLKDIGDASERTAAVVALFGKGSRDLLPLLSKGSEGLKEQAEAAKALGLAFSDFDVERVRQANEGMKQIKSAWQGIGEQVVIDLAGPFKDFTDWFLSSAKDAQGWQDNIMPVCETVAEGFGLVGDSVRAFGGTFHGLMAIGNEVGGAITWFIDEVDYEFQQIGEVVSNFATLMTKVGDLIGAALDSPLGLAKIAWNDFIQFVDISMSKLLAAIARQTDGINDYIHNASAAASHSMYLSYMEAYKAGAALENQYPALSSAIDGMKDAFSNLFTVTAKAPTALSEMSEAYFEAGRENGQAFLDGWDGTHSFADAIAHSFAEAERKSKEAAAKLAKEAAEAANNAAKSVPALSPEQNDQFLRNRAAEVARAESDPEVKHQKEVLALLKQADKQRTLDQAEAEANGMDEAETFYMDPGNSARVVYEARVSELLRKIGEERQQVEEERRQREIAAQEQSVANSLGSIATLANAFAGQSKVLFEVGKAAAIAQAEVNAWITFSATLANASKMGLPLPLAEGEAALGFAAAQVAVINIAQQQPPGRANGGPVAAGGLYQVNERGPEMLSVGDKQYLMMGSQGGHVTPNGGSGPGGTPQKVEVHTHGVPAPTRVEQTTGADGGLNINMVWDQLDQMNAGGIRNGTSKTAQALQGTYGLNRSRGAK